MANHKARHAAQGGSEKKRRAKTVRIETPGQDPLRAYKRIQAQKEKEKAKKEAREALEAHRREVERLFQNPSDGEIELATESFFDDAFFGGEER